MSVPAAYLAVVLIWSTTPLGIIWSTTSISPTFAAFSRMLIALVIGMVVMKLWRIKLPLNKTAYRLYTYSNLGLFVGVLLSYYSAPYLSSGLMSLIFGLSPIVSGVLAQKILGDKKLSSRKKLALAVALMGLFMVCFDNITIASASWVGIVPILLSVSCFSLSGVLVKSVDIDIHPLALAMGSLLLTTPLLAITWLLTEGAALPYQQWQLQSILAIVYLAIFGSLFGLVAYFYILQKLAASTVALVTLLTPTLAIILGSILNGEVVTQAFINGALLIILGLSLYQFGDKLTFKTTYQRLKNKIS